LGYDVSSLKSDRQTLANDLSQAKLGKALKSGQKVYKDVAGVVDKSQQIAGVNQPKGGVKKPTQNLG
jgi:hypothetical protein